MIVIQARPEMVLHGYRVTKELLAYFAVVLGEIILGIVAVHFALGTFLVGGAILGFGLHALALLSRQWKIDY